MDPTRTEGRQPAVVLYKKAEAWQLPSASPACIQVEAYLRFTGVPFHAEVCSSTSRSPTGQTPALEQDTLVAGLGEPGPRSHPSDPSSSVLEEYEAAHTCMRFAQRQIKDLDARLSAGQRAELLAYTVLIQSRLQAAALVSAWCEAPGFAETRKVMQGMPFPLNYVIPRIQQREVRRMYGHLDKEEVYSKAAAAITALADRLRASGGHFFFGAQPCSLDAVLVAHLLYCRRSPAVAPVLQDKVLSQGVLTDYVEHILKEYFQAPGLTSASPPVVEASDWAWNPTWSDAAKGQRARDAKPAPTENERQARRNSYFWLLGAGVALAAFVLFSGQYIKVDGLAQALLADDDDDDGDDDDDDDDDHDH